MAQIRTTVRFSIRHRSADLPGSKLRHTANFYRWWKYQERQAISISQDKEVSLDDGLRCGLAADMKTPKFALVIVDSLPNNDKLWRDALNQITIDEQSVKAIGEQKCFWLFSLESDLKGLGEVVQKAQNAKARMRIAYLAEGEILTLLLPPAFNSP